MSLPEIRGGSCTFCGGKAVACQHAAEFRKAGHLIDEVSKAFEERMLQPIVGLPRVIGGICEMCGVHFLSEKCSHLAKRREAVLGSADAKDDAKVITKDTDELIAEAQAAKDVAEGKAPSVTRATVPPELGGDKQAEAPAEAPSVESSGDAEVDAIMDANPDGNVDTAAGASAAATDAVGSEAVAPGLE